MIDTYPLLRPLLFTLDAERAHDLTFEALDRIGRTPLLRMVAGTRVEDPVRVMGLEFPNRIGLAAGLDKNGAHIDALGQLGFGFIEVGTVTPLPQPGNPKPRIFRLPERRALINRLGFNNEGLDAFVENVASSRWWQDRRGVLGLNIGKNAATPIARATDDYLAGLERVYPHAGYITINVSSPNTKDLRSLQGASEMDGLLGPLAARRAELADRHGRLVPMAVKIAPDLDEAQIALIVDRLLAHGIDGVIATNTTIDRAAVEGLAHAGEQGGLSGAPLLERSNAVIRALRQRLPADFPIIGVGGVMSGADARSKLEAGANLVQIYTGLIYRGPALVPECARALRAAARAAG